MKIGVRLVWKDPDFPVRQPRITALIYVEARNERQVTLAAKRISDSYEADDFEIVG